MSKPFDYSKWDKIELSDDEDDVHPNIDKESWFRMKHRSRVEREEREESDKKRIRQEMDKADQRIKVLEHDLAKLKTGGAVATDVEEDEEDLDEGEGIVAEIAELKKANELRQAKLDEYEKNKTWNVDNICHVKEERTLVNPEAAITKFTPDGFAMSPEELEKETKVKKEKSQAAKTDKKAVKPSATKSSAAKGASIPTVDSNAPKLGPEKASHVFETYHEFTVKYAEIVEEFMAMQELERSKEFLLKHGDILLQENASNYLLLASLEDEMNGYREKMRLTARQSQIISNIAELAKSLSTHPGNVIIPFFTRMEQKVFLAGFLEGVEAFVQKIIARAVAKKIEMDREREGKTGEGVDVASIPKDERLGPGGLDPLEVIETLPLSMQEAFESRDVEQLKEALLQLDPAEAAEHMRRCIDSGLWVSEGLLEEAEEELRQQQEHDEVS